MKYEEVPLTFNDSESRFEFMVEGSMSLIEVRKKGDSIYLTHTEVPPDLEGKGVAAAMVQKTFQYLEDNHIKLIPTCSYVQTYLKRHPEWSKLL